MICNNLSSVNGVLHFNGRDTLSLAKEFGTPLYLMDEDRIRRNCRTYRTAMVESFGENALPLYAGKACCFTALIRIIKEEGLGLDVVSSGEIATAVKAEFPMEHAYFHSNNKTDADIAYAIDCGIGYFVADNEEEVAAVDRIAGEKGIRQKILLRLTPGIDPHTYAAVATGKVDSKFGSAIETGQAAQITEFTLSKTNIDLAGYHCHVGSQVFDSDVFLRSSDIMLEFIAEMRDRFGYTAKILDLGGGFGVRYVESDPALDVSASIARIAASVKGKCKALNLPLPAIRMEPGRSIVADAGLTLYTAGTVKKIPGYKNYVSVDGGMADNPRFALYGSSYTVLNAGKLNEMSDFECSVVGRCCESGDIIQENVKLPSSVCRGDIIAVCTTGAYNYSMASNYNRIPRPPVVMISDGGNTATVAVRRETPEDVLKLDV
ncbi:MAG: diaminopimelate decarboxylase [Clostridia bacterium]|nr:diaminopimelate decarboxylase [Clostridia bacterium]